MVYNHRRISCNFEIIPVFYKLFTDRTISLSVITRIFFQIYQILEIAWTFKPCILGAFFVYISLIYWYFVFVSIRSLNLSCLQGVMASLDVLGCSHYQRKCKLVAPCCDTAYNCRSPHYPHCQERGGWYWVCRFCHDEAESHTVERRNVTEVECLVCHLRQDVGAQCQATDCLTVFGAAYFCSVCKL